MRGLGAALTLLLVTACANVPLAGAAVAAPKQGGPLSPDLAQLSKSAVRQLPPAGQDRALGLPVEGPGSLIRAGRRVLSTVRFDDEAAARVSFLRAAGAEIVAVDPDLQTVTAWLYPGSLRVVALVPGVRSVAAVPAPLMRAEEGCEGGSVISEGIAQLNVGAGREEFAVDGEGVTIGVLSDSYGIATEAVTGGPLAADATEDVETKDLTGSTNSCEGQGGVVDVLEELNPGFGLTGFDEGRAMLQIAHDVAPRAQLAFASAFNGQEKFAQNIKALADPGPEGAGASVIVDDVAYFEEPFFQEGPIAVAIDEVTADGVTYLGAAGNDNLLDDEGNGVGSWEAPVYRDSGDCPAEVRALADANTTHCLDFDPGAGTDRTFGLRVEPGGSLIVDLQWAEPWFGVGTDIDSFLLDEEGRLLDASVSDNIENTQRPVEITQWENPSSSPAIVQLVVNRFAGSGARLKFILLQSDVDGVEYPASGGGDVVGPTIYGHSGAPSAIVAGAVRFSDSSKPEDFSSRGPMTNYFGPVLSSTPASPLAEPEVVSKPDLAATDCGATTFFAFLSAGKWRFCGTSAAAPHAAGVAALLSESRPASTPSEVRGALVGSGKAVGGVFDGCAIGGGLVDALAALEVINEEATASEPAACEAPDASGPVVVAPGFWGEEEPPPILPPPAPTPVVAAPPPSSVPAPRTFFRQRPPKLVRTGKARARVVFRFGSDQAGAVFLCKVGGAGPFRRCRARIVRSFEPGRQVIRVKARNPEGSLDRSPAVYRFRVVSLARAR